MNNRERLKLIIENWFVEKTSIKPTEEGLNNLVDRIYYDKQLNIYGVVVAERTFNCGQERVFGEEKCKEQCKDCLVEYNYN